MNIRIEDIKQIEPYVRDRAQFIRTKDALSRKRLTEYQKRIVALSEKAYEIFSLLWEGENKKTLEKLADDAVVPTMQSYFSASVERAKTKMLHPWNDEDHLEASREFSRFTELQNQGKSGLIAFCEQTLSMIPKSRDTGQTDEFWMQHVKRWEHYKEIIQADTTLDTRG